MIYQTSSPEVCTQLSSRLDVKTPTFEGEESNGALIGTIIGVTIIALIIINCGIYCFCKFKSFNNDLGNINKVGKSPRKKHNDKKARIAPTIATEDQSAEVELTQVLKAKTLMKDSITDAENQIDADGNETGVEGNI